MIKTDEFQFTFRFSTEIFTGVCVNSPCTMAEPNDEMELDEELQDFFEEDFGEDEQPSKVPQMDAEELISTMDKEAENDAINRDKDDQINERLKLYQERKLNKN